LLHTLDLAAPGDIFVFHDINLPNAIPEFAYSCGAMELYQILPQPKWSSIDEKNNVGAYRFDGNYQALWQILSRYLASHKITKENLAALVWLAGKARQTGIAQAGNSTPASAPTRLDAAEALASV